MTPPKKSDRDEGRPGRGERIREADEWWGQR